MQLDKFVSGVVFAMFLLVAGFFVFQGMVDTHDLDMNMNDSGYNESFEATTDLYADIERIKNETLSPDVEGEDESWTSLIKSSYKSVGLVPTVMNTSAAIITSIANLLGIPSFFVTFGIMGLMIGLLFSIIYMVFRFKG
jgi:tetrahydromethanopterin S-methyltransferase subunit A